MKTVTSHPIARRVVDDPMNDAFHALLREAAEKREARQRVHSNEEAAAARQESDDLLALALSHPRAHSQPVDLEP